jgi:dUTP pyrophosphatase
VNQQEKRKQTEKAKRESETNKLKEKIKAELLRELKPELPVTPDLMVTYDSEVVEAKAPLRKAIEGDAGVDLYNASEETITLAPLNSVEIPAGIRVKVPDGCCALVYPRSSTFPKRGLLMMSSLIDSGYTGPIFIHVWHPNLNNMNRPVLIEPWERLGQLIVLPVPKFNIVTVDSLPKTARGDKGFGSTGV